MQFIMLQVDHVFATKKYTFNYLKKKKKEKKNHMQGKALVKQILPESNNLSTK